MPKITLNIVAVTASSSINIHQFTNLLTQSFQPNVKTEKTSGCSLSKVNLVSSSALGLNDFENLMTANSSH